MEMNDFQKKLLEVYESFQKFCKQHDIQYYAYGGTLIGAIRHHGFIPWDDDIDVLMLPEDYQKFCSFKGKINDHFDIVDSRDNGYWLYDLAKFVDTKTTLWEVKEHPFITGVYIDIFPLAECNYSEGRKLLLNYRRLSFLLDRAMSSFSLTGFRENLKADKKFNLQSLIYAVLGLPLFKVIWKQKHTKCLNNIKKGNGDKYVSYESMYGEREIYKKEWFESSSSMPFETLTIPVPNGYHEILTQVFGDYMQLPPEEKRVSHHSHYFLDLNRRWTIDEIKDYLSKQ